MIARKPNKPSAEKAVRDIRRATRRRYSAEEKIRIVLEGLRGEDSIAELCRRDLHWKTGNVVLWPIVVKNFLIDSESPYLSVPGSYLHARVMWTSNHTRHRPDPTSLDCLNADRPPGVANPRMRMCVAGQIRPVVTTV